MLPLRSGAGNAGRPVTFDIPAALPPGLQARNNSHRNYVLSLVRWLQAHGKTVNGFAILNRRTLREMVPEDRWKEIKPELIDAKILESDNVWIKGKKSLGFRLA